MHCLNTEPAALRFLVFDRAANFHPLSPWLMMAPPCRQSDKGRTQIVAPISTGKALSRRVLEGDSNVVNPIE
jgi:hypothetical protein